MDHGSGSGSGAYSDQGDWRDEVESGWPHWRLGRQPSRLLIIAAASLAAAVTVAVVAMVAIPRNAAGRGHSSTAHPAVTVTRLGHRLLGVTAGWDVFTMGPGWVARIQPALGRITRTRVPALQSTGPVSFLAGPGQVIIRPLDFVPGYLVPDGRTAQPLAGALGQGGLALPGPRPGQVWVQVGSGDHAILRSATMPGSHAGTLGQISLGSPSVMADGRGYALVERQGGSYDARPGGQHRITAGTVVAVGPTRWLTLECPGGRHCRNVVIGPAGAGTHRLRGRPVATAPTGVISPDGSLAAVFRISRTGRASLHLINLTSGADQLLAISPGSPGPGVLAWSPDSRWLFVVDARGRLAAVSARSGHVVRLRLPLPAASQVAIRPAPG